MFIIYDFYIIVNNNFNNKKIFIINGNNQFVY